MKINASNRFVFAGTRFAGVSLFALACSSAVHAQTAGAVDTTNGIPETVIVSGSRVITNGNQAPTPVTVSTAEDLQARAPSSIPDALNQLPQFSGSGSPTRNSYNLPGSIQTGNNLNLRDLGPARVLTLFDGTRIVPSASTGLVDSSLIPQLLIERVDVVTGGASAAYGSDAVSGVVNFVLDKKYEGLKYVAQGGISGQGDYASQRLGVAYGAQLDRLHVEASAEYYHNDGIRSINDRPNGSSNYSDVALGTNGAAGSATNPLTLKPNLQGTNIGFGGYVYSTAAAVNTGVLFNPGGQVTQPLAGASYYPASAVCANCATATNVTGSIALVPRQETDQYFGRADYAITDDISAFAQGFYGHSNTFQLAGATINRTGATAFSIFANNAYLPATTLAPNPASITAPATQPAYLMSRISPDLGINSIRQDGNTYGTTAGLTGTVFGGFKWDVDYSYGESQRTIFANVVDNVRLRAAVDAVRDPASGNIVCNVTLTNPGVYPGCVPINLFGVGSPSAAAVAYVRGQTFQTAKYTQDVLEGNVSGDLFDLPYGAVSVALGAASRHQGYRQYSNSDPATFVNPVGIRGFSGTEFVGISYGSGGGTVTVNEGYGEILVPVLKDVAFAKQLDLNGAFRYTDYSTSGGVNSFKLGGVWEPIDGYRLRAAKSRDIRAPTLVELFQGSQTVNNGGFADPHVTPSTSPNFVQTTAGNSKLKPEVANTLTLGGVAEPDFIPGFSLSVDYYHIDVKKAISSLSVPQILAACEASNGTDTTCAAITRPLPFSNTTAANAFTAVQVIPLNAAEVKVSGLDIEGNYHHPLWDGEANLRALVNVPTQYLQQTASNLPFVNYQGNFDTLASPTQALSAITEYHATLSAGYDIKWANFRIDEEVISPMKQSIQFVHAGTENNVAAVLYTNLETDFSDVAGTGATLFFNVANLFDKQPPVISIAVPGSAFQTERTLYDVVGRQFTIGVRGTF